MFRKYRPFFRAGAMDCLAYKFAMLSWLFISILQVLCVIFLWVGVYKSSVDGINSVINGFTYKEMLVYVSFVCIFNFVSLNGDTMYFISDEIEKGTIAMSFVKPISYRARFLFTNLGNAFMRMLLLGLPCFVVSYTVFALVGFITIPNWWTLPLHILLFFAAQVLAIMLCDCIDYIFGVLCFYTTASWGLGQIKNVVISFLSGTLIPISFFPEVFAKILTYSPFSGLSQNPVLILMLKTDCLGALKCIGISLAWLVVLELFAHLLFAVASRKVTVQGG